MNKCIAVIMLTVTAVTAGAAADKKKTTPPPTVKPLVIPKEATPNPDGTYAWTDKTGKKWTFSKTPFGISKVPDMTGSPSAVAAAPAGQFMKATDKGDTVLFERQSPFGTTKWEKKKSELTDEERTVLDRQAAARPEQKPE